MFWGNFLNWIKIVFHYHLFHFLCLSLLSVRIIQELFFKGAAPGKYLCQSTVTYSFSWLRLTRGNVFKTRWNTGCLVINKINDGDTYTLGISMGISAECLLFKFFNFLKQMLFNSLDNFFFFKFNYKLVILLLIFHLDSDRLWCVKWIFLWGLYLHLIHHLVKRERATGLLMEKLLAKAMNADFSSLLVLIKVANKEVLYFTALRIWASPHPAWLLRFLLIYL